VLCKAFSRLRRYLGEGPVGSAETEDRECRQPESLRPKVGHPSQAPGKAFEEVLDSTGRRASGEVVPFPRPGAAPPTVQTCVSPATDYDNLQESELGAFLEHFEDRLTALESGLLSLKYQIGALLRCL
jgi:hypothetical protein